MATLKQGQIWWANLPQPAGRRPVLVLTRSDALSQLTNVTVAPLTRNLRYIPSEVVLSPDEGLPSICAVSLDNLMTIRQVVLDRRITELSRERMQAVFDAIRHAFAMA